MTRRTVGASFAFVGLLTAGTACATRAGQSTASASSSASSQPKATSHKHKRYAKHQPPGQKAPTPDRISEIQSALAREGYYQGDPTGKLDSSTVAALEKFQSANGLDSGGKLDAPTLQKLGLGSDIAGVGAPKPVVPSCCSGSTPASTPAGCCSPTATSNPQTPATATSSSAAPSIVPPDTKPEPK
jgi:hypothetical protein